MKVLCKPFVFIYFLIFEVNYLYSQLKLYPEVGTAFSHSIITTPNEYLVGGKNIFGNYFGFGIYKPIDTGKYLHLTFSNTTTWLAADYKGLKEAKGTSLHQRLFWPIDRKEHLGVSLRNVTLSYQSELFCLSCNKYRSVAFSPIVGISINKIAKQWVAINNFKGFSDSTYSSTDSSNGAIVNLSDSQFLYVGTGNNKNFGDKYIKNYWGMSLQFGFNIQFIKENKDKLCLHFKYNQGLVMLLYSPFTSFSKDEKGEYWQSSFASRGTFWSVTASYPITLVNKKGERYRDRHLKE